MSCWPLETAAAVVGGGGCGCCGGAALDLVGLIFLATQLCQRDSPCPPAVLNVGQDAWDSHSSSSGSSNGSGDGLAIFPLPL